MLHYILLPLVSALIGWFTNFVAVKMLFHPREPRRILGFTIQGIFPKRKPQLAQKAGIIVERELISRRDIQSIIEDPAFIEPVRTAARSRVDFFVREELPEKLKGFAGIARLFLTDSVMTRLSAMLVVQVDETLDAAVPGVAAALEDKLNVRELIETKVNNFSMEKLEDLLFAVMAKEFKFIEWVGGVLGFVIGITQVLILHFIS